jgi:hypothetical protein
VLVPLISLLDTQALYPASIDSEEDVGIPTITPVPIPPPGPYQNPGFIWVGGGGGGGSWCDPELVECERRSFERDQAMFRDYLSRVAPTGRRAIAPVRRMRRSSYYRSRPRAMGQTASSRETTHPNPSVPSFMEWLAGMAKVTYGGSKIAKRYQRRHPASVLKHTVAGVAGFAGSKLVTHVVAARLQPIAQTPSGTRIATSAAIAATVWMATKSWSVHEGLVVGTGASALHEILRLLAA